MGIGAQSLLGRHAGVDACRSILRLKVIWSGSAVLGLPLSVAEGAPAFGWVALAIFVAFLGIWSHYLIRMRQIARMEDA